eukprot:m.61397 g.61397  ORF g.61397 m.61397 type:complete len:74 (+) comp13874_c0_seq2:1373-1594(+)
MLVYGQIDFQHGRHCKHAACTTTKGVLKGTEAIVLKANRGQLCIVANSRRWLRLERQQRTPTPTLQPLRVITW